MRIFVIHSGCDYNKVNEIIKDIENTINNIKILILKKGLPLIWKVNAYNKIKKNGCPVSAIQTINKVMKRFYDHLVVQKYVPNNFIS